MKKMIIGLMTLAAFSVPAMAQDKTLSFSDQLNMQKQLLRPHAFNFFSDRYQQERARKEIAVSTALSFKQQLDLQKTQLRKQEFNPISDVFIQMKAHQI